MKIAIYDLLHNGKYQTILPTRNVIEPYILFLLFPLLVTCTGQDLNRIDYYNTLVVKFTNPEYKNYVYAEYDGPNIRMGYRQVVDEFVVGTSPYIDLGDGYMLVDWKWPWFGIYLSDVIIEQKWNGLTRLDTIWRADSVNIIPKPYIDELYGIYFYDIDAYLHVLKKTENDPNYNSEKWDDFRFVPYFYDYMHWTYTHPFKEEDREEYEKNIAKCDSIQDEYVQKLKYIIGSGNFPFKGRLSGK